MRPTKIDDLLAVPFLSQLPGIAHVADLWIPDDTAWHQPHVGRNIAALERPGAQLPRLRLVRGLARPAGAAWHCGFRRGFMVALMGSDVSAKADSSGR